ncbi:MAG: MFS transporter [Firmicutes bacterium]|nr:MFS transporter [Bacillota bacterium]
MVAGLTRNVFLVGIVSFLTDAASEMIFPLLPVFLTLGALGDVSAPLVVGLLEGLAETTSALLKLVAGVWTDRVRRRKPFILVGYGLSGFVRPLVGLATAWWHPVAIRVADRIGKGLRTSPRDVLIAESTPEEYRGKAFGFHRSMDHLGAVCGPLLAVAFLAALGGSAATDPAKEALLRRVFLWSVLPGAICFLVIALWLRDARAGGASPSGSFRFGLRSFGPDYRFYLLGVLLFTLGNSTDMFLILRAAELLRAEDPARWVAGVGSLVMVPLLWAFFHLFKMLTVTPLGALSDRLGRKVLIELGWVVYALVYLGFAFMKKSWQAWPLFAVYALYYGLTEGVEKALVVDLAPPEGRGTAMGLYHFTVGMAALPASALFGLVYARCGPLPAFGYAAILALLALVVIAFKVHEPPRAKGAEGLDAWSFGNARRSAGRAGDAISEAEYLKDR